MNLDANINNSLTRKDYPQIIAKNRHLASLTGARLKGVAADYAAGTVLAKNSVDSLFYAYDNNASSGLNTAVGVLMETITDNGEATLVGRMLVSGELLKDNLTGLDSGAITDLGARSYTGSDGVNILKF
jgi:hypothetical protein